LKFQTSARKLLRDVGSHQWGTTRRAQIFCGAIARENLKTSWRRDDFDEEIEQGPHKELVAYEDLTVCNRI
jgi:hypothetical protein